MPGEVPWSAAIELRGAGGEPVDLARTLLSHGVADLLPNMIAADGSRLETALTAAGGAWLIELLAGAEGEARLQAPAGAPVPNAAARPALLTQIRHMLRLDEDLSAFYLAAAAEPTLAWVTAGAGRMLRSPTVFEDLVKTICTTNCTWSATVRMVSALVRELGRPAQGAPERHAFPLPEAVAEAGDEFFAMWLGPATGVRTRGPWPPRSPRAGSSSRRWAIRSSPTRRSPSSCSGSPASGRMRRLT